MNRRTFLTVAALTPLAGCGRRASTGVVSSADTVRIAADKAAREKHLAALSAHRVPVGAKFTTPPRPVNLVELFPEVKPLQRFTLRLHPHFSDEPAPGASKLGGRFLWPAAEPWPTCEAFKIPLVPVLQLTADDAPPQVKFKPGSDLMQLLWSPRDHGTGGPKPMVVWRKTADVSQPLAEAPDTASAFLNYVPVPCRVFPERVHELPDWHTVKVTPLREKVEAWKPADGRNPVEFYERELSAAPGTKVGGYPRWLGTPNPPSCGVCKRGMDYLLTIDADEWREPSWIPAEEAKKERYPATGMSLPSPGNIHIYICRRCDDWPATASK
jgi:hypothetical protein